MKLSSIRHWPTNLYTPEQIRSTEAKAAELNNLSLFQLMQQAGKAIFELVEGTFDASAHIGILLGKGNNAGDGLVVAKLAVEAGWQVSLVYMPNCQAFKGEAAQAQAELMALDQPSLSRLKQQNAVAADFSQFDLLVDCVLGTGFTGNLSAEWADIFQQANHSSRMIISADIPSGVNGLTGEADSNAIQAQHTVTFLALKTGLFTHDAADYCGLIHYASLGCQHQIEQLNKAYYQLSDWNQLKTFLPARRRNSHKGSFGHVVCIGGDKGMAGAIRLSAEAALRSGAGKVTVLTHPDNVLLVATGRPELMVRGINGITSEVRKLIEQTDVILIGPGLGKTGWANGLMQLVVESNKNTVVDADGLNWLASYRYKKQNWILTPHPTEAARMLNQSTNHIQHNRFAAATELHAHFGGAIVLKGCGSLIASEQGIKVSRYGNPGMASAGMGDLLAGICAAMLAQGYTTELAAELAVNIHAKAGDLAAKQGERGMIASDLLQYMREVINPSKA
ncbi:carbohydrate kinase [Catenovulum agarivorans DS-2]|uniref:Bifunctional NAD(P)H-hydrate repair enzyme n=1 Tax=Catenovulum agarivorans DS-2 TaxID=1328313 RepID=W7QKU8_9ALTE|nr:bifunctional ADP-dependent NAD(P)H-hydrate dehydratase/NAD(P)H-hydrate epimerase [Catenovulum agarivorans]EWH08713.1 carbohydrate kinase [Catenovulum agarivorans DS-2]